MEQETSVPLHNFQWHLPMQLATGGKPSDLKQAQWLIDHGFRVIISLEPIPDQCEFLLQSECIWLELDVDAEGSDDGFDIDSVPAAVWEEFSGLLGTSLDRRKQVYVHCSAGIKRSPEMVRRYLHLR